MAKCNLQQSKVPKLLQKSGSLLLLNEKGREGKVQLLGRAAVALQGPALSPSTSPHLSKAAFFQLSKSIWWVETPLGGAPPAVKGSGCSNQGFSPFGHCFQLGLEEAGAASPQGAGSGVQIG